MKLPFSPAADFSGMSADKPLYISEVYHRTFLDLDENGTEAAAATSTGVTRGGGGAPRPPPVVRADRPFLFFIQHVETGACLFMGRVLDPAPDLPAQKSLLPSNSPRSEIMK